MKKYLVILCWAIAFSNHSQSQPAANALIAGVDERLELLSIAYRLATGSGFNDTLNPGYEKTIAAYFVQHSNHPFIQYLKQVSDSLAKDSIDISGWEIPSLAMHISQPPELEPLVAYNDTAAVDGWDDRTLLTLKFISLLKQFYTDAGCAAFFKAQQPYYKLVNAEVEKQCVKLDKQWLEDFFSLPAKENYYAVISLQNIGVWDYIRVNFKNNIRNTFTVFGCDAFDENGMPVNFNNPAFARSNLHEYIHAFTNQLVDGGISQLLQPAETILKNPEVWNKVQHTFYNNPPFYCMNHS